MSNGNGSAAPTCPISSNGPQQSSQRQQSQPPGVDIGTVPAAHDLRSVITAINAINNVVQHITRGAPQINNVYPQTQQGVPSPVPEPPPQYARVTWYENGRNYTEEKAVNPDDPEKFIIIKTLASIGWVEEATGHNLIYSK